jgi:hypothetical protein
MNSKKNLTIIIAVVIVVIIGLFMWQGMRNNTGPESTTTTTKDIEAVDITAGSIGDMNDDIFVEITAQSAYYAQKNVEDVTGWVAHMETLYNTYGVTEENIAAYGEALDNDPERSSDLAQKYAQRLTELMDAGE